jgi:hypothetical protein
MTAVPVVIQPTFTTGASRALFESTFITSATVRGYDVTPDGERFLMVQQIDRTPIRPAQLVLVQNWTEELKRLVPVD